MLHILNKRALPHIIVQSNENQPIERERAFFICSTQNRESGGVQNNSDLQTSIFSRSRLQSDGDPAANPRFIATNNNVQGKNIYSKPYLVQIWTSKHNKGYILAWGGNVLKLSI